MGPEPETVRLPVQRPDYRNNGKYQFVMGYTAGGAEECVHLTRDEICGRLTTRAGPGVLVDDGVDLWWETATGPRESP
jgi:hypothetical protein